MADALLGIVLERLVSLAEQQIRDEITLVLGVEAAIESLENTLVSIRDVLEDAERRQVPDKHVRRWLVELKEMAYEIEDVLDEWTSAIHRFQFQTKKKVSACSFIPSPCFCFKLKEVPSRRGIAVKIKAIEQKADSIDKKRARFNFAPNQERPEPERLITTSAINISEVCGRDADIERILDRLLGRSGSNCQEKSEGLYIISIIGAGGMGKTTLAQSAYNHPDVETHFDQRIWVCVSDPFNLTKIFRDILEILGKESPDLHSLEALQQKVKTCISGKKFLLVLDDVWTDKHQLWDQLKNTLTKGAAGSRIIVTTRKESVVMLVRTTYEHALRGLSPEESRAIFHQIAFSGKSEEKEEQLKEIGQKIADKCKGLPLALRTLGNLMRTKNTKEEWETILHNEVWRLNEFETDICPALLLSYYDLPPPIKRCFSYCAVFPKDSVIEVDDLINLWMAQSFLNSDSDASKEMEMLGREYFNDLAARSFFQNFKKDDEDRVVRCQMHDIVHDFAVFLTKNECSIMEDGKDNENEGRVPDSSLQKRRHATIILARNAKNFVFTYKMKNLRTLLFDWGYNSVIFEALPNLFLTLLGLRALDLSHNYDMNELPKEVGGLIHLRYLNLSNCYSLEYLPETICELYNLQTLRVRSCDALKTLPQAMGRLINLRHLENGYTPNLKGLPKGIEGLKFLRTLEKFVVSNDNDECKIEDLRHLKNIRGHLSIKGLGGVENEMEAKTAEMKNKIHLYGLRLDFGWKGMKDVAEALEPHPNLKALEISCYGGIEWPNWMMRSSLTQLKILRFDSCKSCSYLPPLGELPLLENLKIWGMDGVKYLGGEFLGSSSTISFPKLKELHFFYMREWDKWEVKEEERSIMPSLRYLQVYYCQKLERLPDLLLHMKTPLQELDIDGSDILRKRYEKDNGEDWHKVSHIPRIDYE